MAKKELESVIVSYDEYTDMDFICPSKWFIRNSLGDFEFIKVQKREKAQEYFDAKYGVGKFIVRAV